MRKTDGWTMDGNTEGGGAWQTHSMGFSWSKEPAATRPDLRLPARRQSDGPRQGGIALQQRHEGDGIEDTAALGESYGAVFFLLSFVYKRQKVLLTTYHTAPGHIRLGGLIAYYTFVSHISL